MQEIESQSPSLPLDLMEFPSEGLFYKERQKIIEVEYMTGFDEDMLCNQNLIEQDMVWKMIYDKKVKTPNKPPFESLLWCDLLAFMVHIRVNTYGETYETTLTDPNTKQEFKHTFDLTKITFSWDKKDQIKMDDKGLVQFTTSTGKKLKLQILSNEQKKQIKDSARQQVSMGMQVSEKFEILKNTIVEIDGKVGADKIAYMEGVNFTGKDSLEVKGFLNDVVPKINAEEEVTTPSGSRIKVAIPLINPTFFFPALFL